MCWGEERRLIAVLLLIFFLRSKGVHSCNDSLLISVEIFINRPSFGILDLIVIVGNKWALLVSLIVGIMFLISFALWYKSSFIAVKLAKHFGSGTKMSELSEKH